jgi:hypothetical protein
MKKISNPILWNRYYCQTILFQAQYSEITYDKPGQSNIKIVVQEKYKLNISLELQF